MGGDGIMKKKMLSVCIFIVVCVLMSGNLYSQVERTEQYSKNVNTLGLSLGVNDFHIKDEYLSPNIFSGPMFSSKILFQHKTEETRHRVSLYFSAGQINSTDQPRDVKQYVGSIVYSYLHSIYSLKVGENPLELFIGGGISSYMVHTNFKTTDINYDYTFFDQSWYWSHEADIYFRAEYSFGDRYSIAGEIGSPLAGIVSRPENGHYFNANNAKIINNFMNASIGGKPSFLWDNPVLFSEIEYRQRISLQLDLIFDYSFKFTSSNEPLPLRMYTNNAQAGILWQF